MAVRVLIVDARSARSERLAGALAEAGFDVVATVDEGEDLYERVEALEPDAVIVDSALPSRDTLEHVGQLGQRYPKPMIMLSEDGNRELTEAAARAGVSAYVVEGVAPGLVRSLVDVAIAHYRAHRALRSELSRAQRSLEQRKAIDRAKCLLMERQGIGEQAAYLRLRKMAMDRRLSLLEVARELLQS